MIQPAVWAAFAFALLLSTNADLAVAEEDAIPADRIYIQKGEDPSFDRLIKARAFPVGKNSDGGVKGSTIRVNQKALLRYAKRTDPIPKNIKLHTICNSHITRDNFPKWTRWYQEDGNTQVFRMFKGEHNVRNKRPDAGRVETYTNIDWKKGDWHYWIGTYTIVKPHGCMIFQVKNSENDWAVSIGMNHNGDIRLNHRRNQNDVTLARDMVGKPFTLGVRDNGHNYEIYFNGKKVGEGEYNRPSGTTNFRWGMYGKTFEHDAMLLVTGVRFE